MGVPDVAEPIDGYCARYHRAVEMIGRRWTGPILRVLLPGPRRFNEILAAVPNLSDRLLSERLRELECEDVVERHVDPGPPIRATYRLTSRGQDLEPVIRDIAVWAEKWLPPPPEVSVPVARAS